MDRPLKSFVAFEAVVTNTREEGGEAGHFIHDLGGVGVAPVAAHAVGDELDDLPVSFRFAEWLDGFVYALDAAFGAGEGAFFFERRAGRQDEVGVAAGLGEVDVLDNEELEFGEGVRDEVCVGVGGDGVFALDVHDLDFVFEDGVDHLVVVFAGGGGESNAPVGFELGADVGVVDFLVAGEDVGHGAEVAGALDVVVAAERVGSGAGTHVVAGDEEEVGEGGGGVGAAAVLRDTHGEEDADAVGCDDLVGDSG